MMLFSRYSAGVTSGDHWATLVDGAQHSNYVLVSFQ